LRKIVYVIESGWRFLLKLTEVLIEKNKKKIKYNIAYFLIFRGALNSNKLFWGD